MHIQGNRSSANYRKLYSGDYELQRAIHTDRAGIWSFETALANLFKSKEILRDKKAKKYFVC
jgi:hypothetical protein